MGHARLESGLTRTVGYLNYLPAPIVLATPATDTNDYAASANYAPFYFDGLTINFYVSRDGLSSAYTSSTANGYFAGGNTGANVATADKLVFSTDITAAQTSANLSQVRQGPAGVNSSSNGYFVGGSTGAGAGAVVTTADKLVFSTDITAAQTSANLSAGRFSFAGVSSSVSGYASGGDTNGASKLTTTDKLVFSTDTTAAQVSANLSQARSGLAGASGITKGYFSGGITGSVQATTDKLVFSVDVTAAQASANLPTATQILAGNSALTTGYFAGGNTGATVATAYKLVFSTDVTAAQSSANLSGTRQSLSGTDSINNGYFAGGNTNVTDKLVFSTETTAAQASANLSQSRQNLAATSLQPSAYTPTLNINSFGVAPLYKRGNNDVEYINLSVDDLITGVEYRATLLTIPAGGYFVGGSTDTSPDPVTTADKLVFSTDTTAAKTTANLSQARDGLAGVNSSSNGYFAGGNTGGIVATADKLVFLTETTAAQTTANLSQARYYLAGVNSSTNGYFAGGATSTSVRVATADKLAFSTDTTAANATANLSQIRSDLAACNSSTNGYFAGGRSATSTPVVTADKLVFSTDTTAAQVSANLSQARYGPTGVSSSTDGYIAGGFTITNEVATADKLVFSTDTTAAQASANLSTARNSAGGISSSTDGYFGGGNSGSAPGTTTTDKLVFATDTTALQSSADLSQARHRLAGCMASAAQKFILDIDNNDLSYIAGETLNVTDYVYLQEDTVFQTQSVNSKSTRASFLGVAASSASTGSLVNVRTSGQLSGYAFSDYDVQYIGQAVENGTITTNIPTRYLAVGLATNATTLSITIESTNPVNKGYFAGGASGANLEVATTDQMLFATETTTAVTTADLSQARQDTASASEGQTKAYIAGGQTGAQIAVVTANTITFATDITDAVTSANLPAARSGIAGISEGGSKGYFCGGFSGADVEIVTGYVVTFATDTTAAVVASNLSQARQLMGSVSEGSTKGYFCGGSTGAAVQVATGDRITYSTDTTAALASSNLTVAKAKMASVSEGTTKGYFLGGETGTTDIATTDKITYSTDTTAAQSSANLTTGRRGSIGFSNGSYAGYVGGGETAASTSVTTANKVTFSTDVTSSQSSAALSLAREGGAGVSESSA